MMGYVIRRHRRVEDLGVITETLNDNAEWTIACNAKGQSSLYMTYKFASKHRDKINPSYYTFIEGPLGGKHKIKY